MESKLYEKVYGCLLGGLMGDAMGGPTEFLTYQEIEEKYGWVEDFEGSGTDDTVIKNILSGAIFKNGGNVTADEWAEAFMAEGGRYYPLYFAPVRNMHHKLQCALVPPVYAGMGNSPSSSSAMAISPMGIINACDPRRAAAETYDVAGLMHAGESTFCRDGACAIAAAVAEALKPDTTVEAVVKASTEYLHKKSSAIMIDLIDESVQAVKSGMDYKEYRKWYYENNLQEIFCDSRETVPAAIAAFYLAKGEPELTAAYGANFGRDSDTIATMAVSIAGAYKGISAIRKEWVGKIEAYYNTVQSVSSLAYGDITVEVPDYREIAKQFVEIIKKRNEESKNRQKMIDEQMITL